MTDGLGGERQCGAEIAAFHIAEDGAAQLAGYEPVGKTAADVNGGDEQTAVEHSGLNEHAEFTADVPGVDGLDGRLVVAGQFPEIHHLRPVEQLPSVQVGPVVGGEAVREQGVSGVDIGARGVGRSHLEPRGVPEYGQIVLDDITAQTDAARRSEQHLAAVLQHTEGTGIEGI